MKMSLAEALSINAAATLTAKMVFSQEPVENSFILVGKFRSLATSFFDDNAPLIEKASSIEMLWKTAIYDSTGEIQVYVWNSGCNVIFGMNAVLMHENWAEGAKDCDQRTDILLALNACLEKKYRCMCTAKMWKSTCQVNVNHVDVEG